MSNVETDDAARVARLKLVAESVPVTTTAELLDQVLSIGSHQVHGNLETGVLVTELARRMDVAGKVVNDAP